MAIMQRCCCFDNVRSGSNASAIYTLIYSAIVLAYALRQISISKEDDFFIAYCLEVALFALILISSILVLVGVSKDQRGFLLPYMIVMPMLILLQIAQCILLIVAMTAVSPSLKATHKEQSSLDTHLLPSAHAGLRTVRGSSQHRHYNTLF
ncbi:uncharacterized protein LOC110984104 [Acanthaster planci]|uniref:Uncharacterized protein LOC110984104 n=1 Tax=Acanthaster planci TaxID=133434 RepID=A0A8B7Z1Y3_ACAPL|nr:uncharacterized protein LOC110984104 [Acanthaster planci]